jgi:hypothetical protein
MIRATPGTTTVVEVVDMMITVEGTGTMSVVVVGIGTMTEATEIGIGMWDERAEMAEKSGIMRGGTMAAGTECSDK